MKTQRKKGRGDAAPIYRHPLLESISPHLACLSRMKDPTAKRKVKWTPQAAATAAVLMALGGTLALQVRCDDALTCLAQEPRRRALGKTYNGLLKALVRPAGTVLPVVKDHLRGAVKKAWSRMEQTCGWTLLAIDGSKADLPRTVAHEKHFGIADNGKGPQAFVTAIVEVHTRRLWDWRVDRGDASEKAHWVAMADALPPQGLLLADGNFVGYRIWQFALGSRIVLPRLQADAGFCQTQEQEPPAGAGGIGMGAGGLLHHDALGDQRDVPAQGRSPADQRRRPVAGSAKESAPRQAGARFGSAFAPRLVALRARYVSAPRAQGLGHRPRTKSTPKRHLLKPPKIRVATAKERRFAHANYFAIAA